MYDIHFSEMLAFEVDWLAAIVSYLNKSFLKGSSRSVENNKINQNFIDT